MNSKLKVAVLASGRGSNLQALLKNQSAYQIEAVITDKPEAYALEIAKNAGVPVIRTFPRSSYDSKAQQKQAIYQELEKLNPDLICLAGFMQILEPEFVNRNLGKIINIHPSLLPKFTGLDTHKRALEAKEKTHGCSVHFVDAGLDSGPLIAQAECEVCEGEQALAERVLALEHRLYPWVVNGIANSEIKLTENDKISFSERLIKDAELNQFKLK